MSDYIVLYQWGSDTHLAPQGWLHHLCLGPWWVLHWCGPQALHHHHLKGEQWRWGWLSNAAIQILQLDTQMICPAFGQPGKLVMKLGTEPQLQISITRGSLFLFTNRVPVPPSTNWCFPCLKLADLSMQVTVTFLCMWAPFSPFLLHCWISGDAQRDHEEQVITGIEQPGTAARRSLWLRAEAH